MTTPAFEPVSAEEHEALTWGEALAEAADKALMTVRWADGQPYLHLAATHRAKLVKAVLDAVEPAIRKSERKRCAALIEASWRNGTDAQFHALADAAALLREEQP